MQFIGFRNFKENIKHVRHILKEDLYEYLISLDSVDDILDTIRTSLDDQYHEDLDRLYSTFFTYTSWRYFN